MTQAANQPRYPYAAGLVGVGSLLLFVGCVIYALFGKVLGVPVGAHAHPEALQDALRVGAPAMSAAGRFAFIGDLLITAGAIGLVSRRRAAGRDLESAAWGLVAASTVAAVVFDSLFAVILHPLAVAGERQLFFIFKAWFDLLFAMSMVPFGLGGVVLFGLDARSADPLLPRWIAWAGILLSAGALAGGLGFGLGVLFLPVTTGTAITFGTLPFAALGIQLARREW